MQSGANADLIRRAFELWNAGDMEALRDLYHPDMIMRGPPDWPEPGPFVGRDAVLRQLMRAREPFDRDSVSILGDIVDVGNRALVRMSWQASGRGPEGTTEWTLLYEFRGGLVFSLEYFPNHDESLEAVGIPQPPEK